MIQWCSLYMSSALESPSPHSCGRTTGSCVTRVNLPMGMGSKQYATIPLRLNQATTERERSIHQAQGTMIQVVSATTRSTSTLGGGGDNIEVA